MQWAETSAEAGVRAVFWVEPVDVQTHRLFLFDPTSRRTWVRELPKSDDSDALLESLGIMIGLLAAGLDEGPPRGMQQAVLPTAPEPEPEPEPAPVVAPPPSEPAPAEPTTPACPIDDAKGMTDVDLVDQHGPPDEKNGERWTYRYPRDGGCVDREIVYTLRLKNRVVVEVKRSTRQTGKHCAPVDMP
jgi:hypothetical protein